MTRLRLLTIAILVLAASYACDKKKDEPKKTLDPNAKITIQITDAGLRAKGNYSKTREECLQRLEIIKGVNPEGYTYTYSITEQMKDYDKLQVKMWGDAIIDPRDNSINPNFIRSKNVVFVDSRTPADTLGYIPNAVLDAAYQKIKAAHEAGNYEEVYRLFLESYTAIPCTGEEYRQMQAEGRN